MEHHTLQMANDLSEELNKSRRELSILYEISNAMRTTLELNHILYIILTGVTAHSGLGFNRAILFLVNQADQCLEPKMAIGPESGEHAQKVWDYISKAKQHIDDLIQSEAVEQNIKESSLYKSIKELKIPISTHSENLLAQAYLKGTPVHISPEKIQQFSNDPFLQKFKTTELVIMPLKAKNTVNGIIVADNLYTQKSITTDDLKIFMMLANQAGLAIENSRLYEMVKHKSHTDSITNLWNHGFFQNQLSREIEISREHDNPLSLMIIDIDNFKSLNDTYGHQNGDIVLKKIANILDESSRDIDYVCRYGGEEFTIILTETTKDQGTTIAERIRQKIEQYPFPKFSSNENLRVTVSIGLASFPDDAKTKEELITKADKTMYVAKFGGKNQTRVA